MERLPPERWTFEVRDGMICVAMHVHGDYIYHSCFKLDESQTFPGPEHLKGFPTDPVDGPAVFKLKAELPAQHMVEHQRPAGIEITEEMIAAATKALLAECASAIGGLAEQPVFIARMVLEAALACRTEHG